MKTKTILRTCLTLAAVAVALRFSFHTESLSARQERERLQQFNPEEKVAYFWSEHREALADRALDFSKLCDGLRRNPSVIAAREGRVLGIGSKTCFVVKGESHDFHFSDNRLYLTLDDRQPDGKPIQVVIPFKYIFGNLARDASGWFHIDDFQNTMDFNAVSACLNRLIRDEVVAGKAKEADNCERCRFCGAVELKLPDYSNPSEDKLFDNFPSEWMLIPYMIDFD